MLVGFVTVFKFFTDLHSLLLAWGGPPHCPGLTVPLPVIHAHDHSPWGKLSGAARAAPIMPDQTEREERYLAEATLIEVLLCVKPSTKHFLLQCFFHFSQQLLAGKVITPIFGNEEKQTTSH